jgi:hypothetical protein
VTYLVDWSRDGTEGENARGEKGEADHCRRCRFLVVRFQKRRKVRLLVVNVMDLDD